MGCSFYAARFFYDSLVQSRFLTSLQQPDWSWSGGWNLIMLVAVIILVITYIPGMDHIEAAAKDCSYGMIAYVSAK